MLYIKYLKNLGLPTPKDVKQSTIENSLATCLGTDKAHKLMDLSNDVNTLLAASEMEKYNKAMERLLKMKESSLDVALAMNLYFCREYLLKVCRMLEEHADEIGDEVLDLGCDEGVISCFVATLKPESHITAIDNNPRAVELGRELAKRLNLTNISFECADLKEYKAIKKASTVLAFRVMYYMPDFTDFDEAEFNLVFYDFKKSIDMITPVWSRLPQKVNEVLIDKGTFFWCDPYCLVFGNSYELFAKIQAFLKAGIELDPKFSCLFACPEQYATGDFVAAVGRKVKDSLSLKDFVRKFEVPSRYFDACTLIQSFNRLK